MQEQTGRVVSYEEPLLVFRGDLEAEPGGDPNRKWGLFPKRQRILLPAEQTAGPDMAGVLNRKVQAYNSQSRGTQFRVEESTWGLHVIPVQARDESGRARPVRSLLDAPVSVQAAERMPREHLGELVAALNRANGIRLELSAVPGKRNGFDKAFQAMPARFSWGVENLTGRTALIGLLERSATTFSWHLLCQSSALPEDRFCALNLGMIEVEISGPERKPERRVLRFDRCRDSRLQLTPCFETRAPGGAAPLR
jgi:hypothetical protein